MVVLAAAAAAAAAIAAAVPVAVAAASGALSTAVPRVAAARMGVAMPLVMPLLLLSHQPAPLLLPYEAAHSVALSDSRHVWATRPQMYSLELVTGSLGKVTVHQTSSVRRASASVVYEVKDPGHARGHLERIRCH